MKKLVNLVAALLLLAVTVTSSSMVPAEPMVWPDRGNLIAVMTFNVKTSFSPRIFDSWFTRKPMVIHIIRSEAPDIVALQEADPWQIWGLSSELPGYKVVWPSQGNQWLGYPTLLVREDRFEQVGEDRLWFSAAPQIAESVTWGNKKPRCFTTANLYDELTGNEFVIASVHLDYRSHNSREESARLLATWTSQQTKPVIVAGDFNEAADSTCLDSLRLQPSEVYPTNRLFDSYTMGKAEEKGTLHGFTGKASDRIDLILVSDQWEVADSYIDEYHLGDRYPSDHYPVTATLRLPKKLPELRLAGGYEPADYDLKVP